MAKDSFFPAKNRENQSMVIVPEGEVLTRKPLVESHYPQTG
ncbi:hypothetical protein [Zavarzinella formosa]|nr:hypothetical protein [Zavarzinella formosa]